MVNRELLQKFMLTLTPDEGKANINNMFASFSENKLAFFQSGFHYLQSQYDILNLPVSAEDRELQIAVINSMCFGMMAAAISEDPSSCYVLEKWVETCSRNKGEHVIDFNMAKASKRRL